MLHRQTTIRREGWYYLLILIVVFGGAIYKEVNLLLVLAGMMLGPVLLNLRAVTTNLRGLMVQRQMPATISAGDRLSIGLNLVNPRRRLGAWAVVVEERIRRLQGTSAGENDAALSPQVLFPYVPAGQSRKGGYRGVFLDRGRYESALCG